MKHNLILFGFKGSGKTYWGSRLAKELGCRFIDTDRLLEDLHGENLSCHEIYTKYGNQVFRQWEQKAIVSLKGVDDCVIALGGGAILDQSNQKVLEEIGRLIYLDVDQNIVKERMKAQPTSLSFDPKRESIYQSIPAHHIQVDEKIINNLKRIAYGK